jgi:hypothetical protein
MPIDPSIPLQAQPLKLESPMNQLAMAGEMMKIGEYKQAAEERNFLRNRMAKGNFDIADPTHRQEIMAGAPTVGGKFLSDTASMQKNLYQGEKFKEEIDTSRFDKAINHTINEPNADAAAKTIMKGMADKSIPMDKGQAMLEDLKVTPFAAWTTKTLKGLVGAREQFVQDQTNKRSQANLDQQARFHSDVQNRPQYIQTDAGLVAVPNVLKPGQAPVGVPVMGANGENLGKPLKDIPATVNKAIIENDISMNKANRALDLLQGKDVTTPKGDVIKGSADATGFWKGLTPQVILNKWDPGGVSTRAFVADIGSLKVHDRSGAAVTASETPRLKPFIPSIYDAPDVAAEKLINFKAEYEDIQRGLTETYSKEQGYRPSPLLSGKGSGGGNKPSLDSIFNPPKPKQ